MIAHSRFRAAVAVTLAVATVTIAGGAVRAQQQAGPPRANARGGVLGAPMLGGGRGLAALRWGLGQLNLTPEQKQQVKTILQGHRQEMQAFAAQVRQARLSLAEAITGAADEAAVRAKAADVAKVQADIAVFVAQLRKEVLGVLTPEQQAKAKDLRLEAMDRARKAGRRQK